MYAKTQIIIESRRYAGENSMALNISAIRIVADVMKNPMNARIHTPSTSAALTRFIPSSYPELAPSNASSSSALGCFFRGYEEALNAFQQSLTVTPGYAKVHLSIGRMLFALGRSEEAIESIQSAITLRPDLVSAYATLGEIHAARGEYVDAIGAYGRASELSPEDDSLHARMSRVHLAAGQIDAANAECKYLQDRQSKLAAALRNEIDNA